MVCTLDDVPELAARMARTCPGCGGDGGHGPLAVAGKVVFGYLCGLSKAAESRDLESLSRMQKDAGTLEF
jgi:hypothetical protein